MKFKIPSLGTQVAITMCATFRGSRAGVMGHRGDYLLLLHTKCPLAFQDYLEFSAPQHLPIGPCALLFLLSSDTNWSDPSFSVYFCHKENQKSSWLTLCRPGLHLWLTLSKPTLCSGSSCGAPGVLPVLDSSYAFDWLSLSPELAMIWLDFSEALSSTLTLCALLAPVAVGTAPLLWACSRTLSNLACGHLFKYPHSLPLPLCLLGIA